MVDASSADVINDAMREAADLVSVVQDDLLSCRLQSARAAQEALYSRSRGGGRLLPPPPSKLLGNGYASHFSEEEPPYYRPDLDSPRGYRTPWRGLYSPPREEFPPARTMEFPPMPPSRTYSHPHTPTVGDYGYIPMADMYPAQVPTFSSVRRSESVPVMPSSAQFLLHTMTPVTVVTPAASPRTDVDASRAAVVSCRMLAEAGRAAAARCADEAARQAERRVYDEMRRSQDAEAGALADRLRAENARLQEELLAERNRLSASESTIRERDLAQADMEHYKKMSEEKDQALNSLRNSIKQQKEEIEMLKTAAMDHSILKEEHANKRNELELLKAQHDNETDAFRTEIDQLRSNQRRYSQQNSNAQARFSAEIEAIIKERDIALSDVANFKKISEEKDQALANLRHSIKQQAEQIEVLKAKSEAASEVKAEMLQAIDPIMLEERDRAQRDVASLRVALAAKDSEIQSLRERDIAKAGNASAYLGIPATYSARPSDVMSFSSRTSPRASLKSATNAVQMLEVDLTSDMSPAMTPVEDTFGMDRRGSMQSHISADLLNSDDEDVVITTHTSRRHSRLGAAGFS